MFDLVPEDLVLLLHIAVDSWDVGTRVNLRLWLLQSSDFTDQKTKAPPKGKGTLLVSAYFVVWRLDYVTFEVLSKHVKCRVKDLKQAQHLVGVLWAHSDTDCISFCKTNSGMFTGGLSRFRQNRHLICSVIRAAMWCSLRHAPGNWRLESRHTCWERVTQQTVEGSQASRPARRTDTGIRCCTRVAQL